MTSQERLGNGHYIKLGRAQICTHNKCLTTTFIDTYKTTFCTVVLLSQKATVQFWIVLEKHEYNLLASGSVKPPMIAWFSMLQFPLLTLMPKLIN